MTDLNDEVASIFEDRREEEIADEPTFEMAAKANNDINVNDIINAHNARNLREIVSAELKAEEDKKRFKEVEEKKTQRVLPLCIGKVIAKN